MIHVGSGTKRTYDKDETQQDSESVEVRNILGGGQNVRLKDNLPKFERDGADKYVKWKSCEEDKNRLNEKIDRMLQG